MIRVVVCVDDRGGMMFNHRRQSRDRAVVADVIASLAGGRLWIAPYSEKLFAETGAAYAVSEDFLTLAEEGDVCFVEDRSLSPWAERIREVTIYRWNRHYPADLSFDLNLAELGFRLCERSEWQGYSHEKITKEIFVK